MEALEDRRLLTVWAPTQFDTNQAVTMELSTAVGWAASEGQDGPSPHDGFDSVAFDAQGNMIAVGSRYGYSTSSSNSSDADILVTKYNQMGDLIWRYTVGSLDDEGDNAGDDADWARDVAIDPVGNIYVIGAFRNQVDFDPNETHAGDVDILIGAGSFDAFVLKLDPQGQFLRASAIGGGSGYWDQATAIAIDQQGDYYITGQFGWLSGGAAVDFDPAKAYADNRDLKSASAADGFLAKYDSAGDVVWVRSFAVTNSSDPSTRFVSPGSLAIDAESNVWVGGCFQGLTDFDRDNTYTDNRDLLHVAGTEFTDSDAFIVQFDSSGGFVWAKGIGGEDYQTVTGLSVDTSGNVYAVGRFQNLVDFDPGPSTLNISSVDRGFDAFAIKLTSVGDLDWARAVGSTGDDRGGDVVLDVDGNVVVVGQFQDTVDFDPSQAVVAKIPAYSGATNGFTWTLSPTGQVLDARRYGGDQVAVVQSVAAGAGGELALAGYFSGSGPFDAGDAYVPLASAGGMDAFVVSIVSDTIAPTITGADMATNDNAPQLTGTVDDPLATVRVTVAGTTYDANNLGNGDWILPDDTISPALADEMYIVAITATDPSGNTSAGNLNLTIDISAPEVTVNSLTTTDRTPAITGTVSDGTLQVIVNGKVYTVGDGSLVVAARDWTLQIPAADALTDGPYDVVASATDSAGNVGTDGTTHEVVIQTPPQVTLSITPSSVERSEGTSVTTLFVFAVTRTGDTTGVSNVQYNVTGRGANPADAADFGGTLPRGTISFAAGEVIKSITIAVRGDSDVELDEGFTVTLSAASGAQILVPSADGLIQDDDAPLIDVTVVFADSLGNPLDSNAKIGVGDDFRIYVYAQDLRESGAEIGVLSTFLDLSYDKSILTVTGIVPLFEDFNTGAINAAAGSIDEVGGLDNTQPTNRNPQPVFYLEATAIATGLASVDTNEGENQSSKNQLFGIVGDLRDQTQYNSGQLVISSIWHNDLDPNDVNGSGYVTPADLLILINRLNTHVGDPTLPAPPASPPPYYDVNNDGYCTSSDVLEVINYLNRQADAAGEGEMANGNAVLSEQAEPQSDRGALLLAVLNEFGLGENSLEFTL